MVRTNNGFEIAEADLRLRGAGNIMGTQQSGSVDFNLVNLATDTPILEVARNIAITILEKDPELKDASNLPIRQFAIHLNKVRKDWGMIS